MDEAPREILNRAWQKLVIQRDASLDRRFYTFCVLEKLQDGFEEEWAQFVPGRSTSNST